MWDLKSFLPEFYTFWRCKKKGHGTAVLPNIENVLPNNKVSLFNSQHLNKSPKIPTATVNITVGLFEFLEDVSCDTLLKETAPVNK